MSEKELKELQSDFAFIDMMSSSGTGNISFLVMKMKNLKIKIYQEQTHPRPHIHIDYGNSNHVASYSIKEGERLAGNLPNKYDKKVKSWINTNEGDLIEIWGEIQNGNKENYELLIAGLN